MLDFSYLCHFGPNLVIHFFVIHLLSMPHCQNLTLKTGHNHFYYCLRFKENYRFYSYFLWAKHMFIFKTVFFRARFQFFPHYVFVCLFSLWEGRILDVLDSSAHASENKQTNLPRCMLKLFCNRLGIKLLSVLGTWTEWIKEKSFQYSGNWST